MRRRMVRTLGLVVAVSLAAAACGGGGSDGDGGSSSPTGDSQPASLGTDAPAAADVPPLLEDGVVSDAALAGVCASLRNGAEALGALEDMGVHYNPVESKSALRAGEMQRRQRQRSGEARPIADFLVGAHALLQCDALITYDTGFHRDYFKGLKLIAPKT